MLAECIASVAGAGCEMSCGGSAGGVYYKGSVTDVREQMPSGGMGLLSKGTYDPWEALAVEWDVGGDAEGMDRVSPWEIEVCTMCQQICSLNLA